MGCSVYVLESVQDGNLYIGVAQDVKVRLKRHNVGGVRSTRHRRPLRLLGSKQFDTLIEAREVEVYLKSLKDPVLVRRWIQKPS